MGLIFCGELRRRAHRMGDCRRLNFRLANDYLIERISPA